MRDHLHQPSWEAVVVGSDDNDFIPVVTASQFGFYVRYKQPASYSS